MNLVNYRQQSLCHNDSTINTVLSIRIIISSKKHNSVNVTVLINIRYNDDLYATIMYTVSQKKKDQHHIFFWDTVYSENWQVASTVHRMRH